MMNTRRSSPFAVTLLALALAVCALMDFFGQPRPQKPTPPVCKVCHCGKTSCHRECSDENMCVLHCERLCKK
jgi:hypothetical protein